MYLIKVTLMNQIITFILAYINFQNFWVFYEVVEPGSFQSLSKYFFHLPLSFGRTTVCGCVWVCVMLDVRVCVMFDVWYCSCCSGALGNFSWSLRQSKLVRVKMFFTAAGLSGSDETVELVVLEQYRPLFSKWLSSKIGIIQ